MSDTKYGHSTFGSEEQFCTAENILSGQRGQWPTLDDLQEVARKPEPWDCLFLIRISSSVECPFKTVCIDHLCADPVTLYHSATYASAYCRSTNYETAIGQQSTGISNVGFTLDTHVGRMVQFPLLAKGIVALLVYLTST